jgi:hypothetical protein
MQDAINSFSNIVLQAVLPVLAATIAGFAVVLLKKGIAYAQANIDKKTQSQIEWLVGIVVQAAEQSELSGQLAAYGNDKKAWAIVQLQTLMSQYNLPAIDLEALSVLIEREVFTQFTQFAADKDEVALNHIDLNAGNEAKG